MGVGTGVGLCFDVRLLGDMARLSQHLHHAYIWNVLGDTRKSFSVDQSSMF